MCRVPVQDASMIVEQFHRQKEFRVKRKSDAGIHDDPREKRMNYLRAGRMPGILLDNDRERKDSLGREIHAGRERRAETPRITGNDSV